MNVYVYEDRIEDGDEVWGGTIVWASKSPHKVVVGEISQYFGYPVDQAQNLVLVRRLKLAEDVRPGLISYQYGKEED